MNATAYISLARNYSLVLLILCLFAIANTRQSILQTHRVEDARTAMAELIVAGALLDRSLSLAQESQYASMDLGILSAEITRKWEVDKRDAGSTNWVFGVKIDQVNGRKWWRSISDQRFETLLTPTNTMTLRDLSSWGDLKSIFKQAFRKNVEGDDYRDWYLEIEHELSQQSIPLPGVDLRFRVQYLSLIYVVSVLVFLLQIRNQVRRSLLDKKLGIDEPWLVLDGQRGLERFVALLWILGLSCCPLILAAELFMYITDFIYSFQAGASAQNLGIILGAFVCLGLSTWIPVTTTAEILRVRWLRLSLLESLKQGAAELSAVEPLDES